MVSLVKVKRKGLAKYRSFGTLGLLFNLINVITWSALVCGAVVAGLLQSQLNSELIPLVFISLLGAVNLLAEFNQPTAMSTHFMFLRTFLGRGITYLLCSTTTYRATELISIICCYLVVVVGITYLLLSFIPKLPLLKGMKQNLAVIDDNLKDNLASGYVTEPIHIRTPRHSKSKTRSEDNTLYNKKGLVNGKYKISDPLCNNYEGFIVPADLVTEINNSFKNGTSYEFGSTPINYSPTKLSSVTVDNKSSTDNSPKASNNGLQSPFSPCFSTNQRPSLAY